jgi:glycerol-3-phosphate dehydrogenase
VREDDVAEGEVSRKHAVLDHERQAGVGGIISVLGGKLTAYRGIAEQVGDLVAHKLGRRAPGYSDRRSLPGGRLSTPDAYLRDEIVPWAQQLGLDDGQARHLGRVYGALAADVLRLAEREPALRERACPDHPTLVAELARAVHDEWALSLGDVLLRRTTLGLDARQGLDCLPQLAAQVGRFLDWDEPEQQRQIELYRATLEPMRRFSTLLAAAA